MSNGKYLILGFIIGGTISAATTLLTTPTSGKNDRTSVMEQDLEWKGIVDDIIQDTLRLKDQLAKTSKEGVVLMNDLTEDIKTSVDEWKSDMKVHNTNIE